MTDVITQSPPEAESNGEKADPTLSGPIVGIIYPPPEVRSKY